MIKHTISEIRNLKILFLLLLIYLLIPTSSATIKAIPFILLYFYCFTRKDFINNKSNRHLLIIYFTLTIIVLLLHGILEAKDYFFLLYGILCLKYLSPKYAINSNDFYKYYFYILIPVSIITFLTQGGKLSYIPDANMSINICAGESTKHGTATIGYLLFIASLYQFTHDRIRDIKVSFKTIFFFIFSIYLIFFSTSRSVALSTAYVLALYAINYKKIRPKASFLFLFFIIISTFLLENLSLYIQFIGNNEIINKFIRAENFDQSAGVTSGRAWLWKYHWDTFIDTHLIGGGREAIDFSVDDLIPSINEVAKAATESPLTGILACYGILGCIPLFLYFYLFYYAIKKRNLMGSCIILGSIYNALTGVNLLLCLDATSILLYLLYFQSFRTISLTNPININYNKERYSTFNKNANNHPKN